MFSKYSETNAIFFLAIRASLAATHTGTSYRSYCQSRP
jgi:hypothetical protein